MKHAQSVLKSSRLLSQNVGNHFVHLAEVVDRIGPLIIGILDQHILELLFKHDIEPLPNDKGM